MRSRSVGRLFCGFPVLFPCDTVAQRAQRQHSIEIPYLPPCSRLLESPPNHTLTRFLHLTTPERRRQTADGSLQQTQAECHHFFCCRLLPAVLLRRLLLAIKQFAHAAQMLQRMIHIQTLTNLAKLPTNNVPNQSRSRKNEEKITSFLPHLQKNKTTSVAEEVPPKLTSFTLF